MLHFKPFKEFESVITGHSSQEVSDKNWFVSILYLPKEKVTDGFWKDQLEYLLQKFSETADDYWLLYCTLFFLVKLYLPKEEVTGGLWKDQLEYLLQNSPNLLMTTLFTKWSDPEEKHFSEDNFVSIIQSSPIDYLFQTFYCFSNTVRVFISELQYLNENCIDFQLQSL